MPRLRNCQPTVALKLFHAQIGAFQLNDRHICVKAQVLPCSAMRYRFDIWPVPSGLHVLAFITIRAEKIWLELAELSNSLNHQKQAGNTGMKQTPFFHLGESQLFYWSVGEGNKARS